MNISKILISTFLVAGSYAAFSQTLDTSIVSPGFTHYGAITQSKIPGLEYKINVVQNYSWKVDPKVTELKEYSKLPEFLNSNNYKKPIESCLAQSVQMFLMSDSNFINKMEIKILRQDLEVSYNKSYKNPINFRIDVYRESFSSESNSKEKGTYVLSCIGGVQANKDGSFSFEWSSLTTGTNKFK